MNDELLLVGARVVDPLNAYDGQRDIGIRDGVIVDPTTLRDPERLHLQGKVVAPGFIDLHVHLRYPGQTHKEDIRSGTAAAAAGGFTTVLAMPNTVPTVDNPTVLADVLRKAATEGSVHVLQAGALTVGRQGDVVTDIAGLKAAGAPVVTDDGSTPQLAGVMRQAMIAAAAAGIAVIDHCEDCSLARPGVMHDGAVARELGLPGQPRSAEEVIVARDIILAAETGCRLHLQHLSSAGSVAMLRLAQQHGLPVTGEACPHHLFLTDEACRTFGVNAKMAPPLREEADRQALIDGLRDGTLCAIATDHAPHSADEKAAGWTKAPFGIIGLEAAVPLCLSELYNKGVLTLPQLIALFTVGPRKVLGLPVGSLELGATADVTILDPDAKHSISVESFASRSRNCPYDGWQCRGKVVGTLVGSRR
ncbi:MAG: dihydroorotase [Lentisphaeria bacterium]|nr:dihydroorotase [Lentisphaeria bacterium]